jgi:hypothetical protein
MYSQITFVYGYLFALKRDRQCRPLWARQGAAAVGITRSGIT